MNHDDVRERLLHELDRAIERIMGVEIEAMQGDNLAVTLCSVFDRDDGSEPDDNGWSQSAIDAYEEIKSEIASLFVPVRVAAQSIAALQAEVEGLRGALLDEDWLEETISDSLEMDWHPRDAAKLIIARHARQALAQESKDA